MVTTHKISADWYDDSYELIALHTVLEGYTMAYQLNKYVGLRLHRTAHDIEIGDFSFQVYDWQDEVADRYWVLFKNSTHIEEESAPIGFFTQTVSTKMGYLIEERKEVDFFLRISTDDVGALEDAINQINTIQKVVTAYRMDHQVLKSRRNLIF